MSCLTVSRLNEIAKGALTLAFDKEIWVVGEVHGLRVHAKSSHMYFDLVEKAPDSKDQYIAKVSCAFFKGLHNKWENSLKNQGIPSFTLTDGMEVKVKAQIDLYTKEGRFQLIIHEIDLSYTLGYIAKKRMQTIEALKSSGIMDRNKSLLLPFPALSIGLITSKGSAAYNDFVSILRKSKYAFKITLFNAYMQGQNTIDEVIKGIKSLEYRPGIDVIAIIRGGGARAELFYFDDINICKAIATSKLPIITGIGHEIDISVADMTSFDHFVTPTDVARFLVDRVEEFWDKIVQIEGGLTLALSATLKDSKVEIGELAGSLGIMTQKWIAQALDNLKFLAHTLSSNVVNTLSIQREHIARIQERAIISSKYLLQAQERVITQLYLYIKQGASSIFSRVLSSVGTSIQALSLAGLFTITQAKAALERLHTMLNAVDPEVVLGRGYSITLGPDGSALVNTEGVSEGDRLTTILYKGKIISLVEDKEPI